MKPSRSDYKEFRDDAMWSRSKERIVTTLHAHGLHHLVEEGFVSTNPVLDAAQMPWIYKIFQDIIQAPTVKNIVTKHLTTKDTRACWKEICEHFDNSMTTEIKCSSISSYLTSSRLEQLNW